MEPPTNDPWVAFAAHAGTLDTAEREPLRAKLFDLLEGAERSWPDVRVDTIELAAYAGRAVAAADGVSIAALERFCWDDLGLARACARRVPRAIMLFEERYLRFVDPLLQRVAAPSAGADDLKQIVREHLLVGDAERPPAIERYAGRGSLRAWLQIVVTRLLIDRSRVQAGRREHVAPDEMLAAHPDERRGPESAYGSALERKEVKAAFAHALGTLTIRQRNLLRHQLLHGLTLDDLATLYRVHRATIARQLAAARSELVEATRERLMARLRQSSEEVHALLHDVVDSQLDLSIHRALRTTPETE